MSNNMAPSLNWTQGNITDWSSNAVDAYQVRVERDETGDITVKSPYMQGAFKFLSRFTHIAPEWDEARGVWVLQKVENNSFYKLNNALRRQYLTPVKVVDKMYGRNTESVI